MKVNKFGMLRVIQAFHNKNQNHNMWYIKQIGLKIKFINSLKLIVNTLFIFVLKYTFSVASGKVVVVEV